MSARRIRVGIIGVHPEKGWATTAHLPALRQLPQFCLSAISHHQRDTAKAAAELNGAPHYFDSAQELVHHPDVDLVVVAVKVTRHKEIVLSALQAGKAVLCEWPLAMNLPDAVAMRDCARAMRATTAAGLQTRATPVFAYLRLSPESRVQRVACSKGRVRLAWFRDIVWDVGRSGPRRPAPDVPASQRQH